MRVDTRDLVSVSDASQRGVSWLVNEAVSGRTPVVMKQSKPVAVVVGIEQMERLQRLDDIEADLRLWAVTLIRDVTDNGNRHSLDDVASQLGIDLLADEDDA